MMLIILHQQKVKCRATANTGEYIQAVKHMQRLWQLFLDAIKFPKYTETAIMVIIMIRRIVFIYGLEIQYLIRI